MHSSSELDRYLDTLAEDSQLDSEGEFSLSIERSLAKLSQFQLPFPDAWAVKVVQALVAGGARSIEIRHGRRATQFNAALSPAWSTQQVRDAFVDPSCPAPCGIRHLTSGLWATGLHRRLPFLLSLPGEATSLLWDGESLVTIERGVDQENFHLELSQRPKGVLVDSHDFSAFLGIKAQRSTRLFSALNRCVRLCPVPLTFDSMSLVGIPGLSQHGWKAVVLCGGRADTLPLPINPWIFKNSVDSSVHSWIPSLWSSSVSALEKLEPISTLLVLYTTSTPKTPNLRPCRWHWVQDGAVIATEDLSFGAGSGLAFDAYLSANGLNTDLTTFALTETPELSQRRALGHQAIKDALLRMEVATKPETLAAALKSKFRKMVRDMSFWSCLAPLGAGNAGGLAVYLGGVLIVGGGGGAVLAINYHRNKRRIQRLPSQIKHLFAEWERYTQKALWKD